MRTLMTLVLATILGISVPGFSQPFGDATDDGVTNVVDVTCAINVSLWNLSGAADPFPSCVAVGALYGVDLNCDDSVDVTDVSLAIDAAFDVPLDPAIDGNGDGWPDACKECDADADCSDNDSCTIEACVHEPGSPRFECEDQGVWSWCEECQVDEDCVDKAELIEPCGIVFCLHNGAYGMCSTFLAGPDYKAPYPIPGAEQGGPVGGQPDLGTCDENWKFTPSCEIAVICLPPEGKEVLFVNVRPVDDAWNTYTEIDAGELYCGQETAVYVNPLFVEPSMVYPEGSLLDDGLVTIGHFFEEWAQLWHWGALGCYAFNGATGEVLEVVGAGPWGILAVVD